MSKIEYVKCKCKDCTNRTLTCHSECEDYKRFLEYREQVKKQQRLDSVYSDYASEAIARKERQRRQ